MLGSVPWTRRWGVQGESLAQYFTGPTTAMTLGVVTLLGCCQGDYTSFSYILDVVTSLEALFYKSWLCGVLVGPAVIGHAKRKSFGARLLS
uniref:Uncharacterized protein n=1 Tax=Leersia perrieri TaxID=77586 RepID=A0A0D9XAD9_9ORYZ